MSEEKYTPEEYFATYDGVVVEADGDMKMAHFEDFTNLQESPCAFGVTDADAIAALALQCKDSSTAMLEALEFCCRRTTPGADCWCQINRGLLMDGQCSAETTCPVWQAIQKAKGVIQ